MATEDLDVIPVDLQGAVVLLHGNIGVEQLRLRLDIAAVSHEGRERLRTHGLGAVLQQHGPLAVQEEGEEATDLVHMRLDLGELQALLDEGDERARRHIGAA